jgi:PAS domain S-box-containing protein
MNRSQNWLEQVTPVLETLNQGVIINDENARIVFANAVFLEMIGLPAREVVGRAVTELFPPDDVPQLLRYIEQRKNSGRSRYEFYLPQPGGGRLPVLVTARQVNAPNSCLFGRDRHRPLRAEASRDGSPPRQYAARGETT